MTTRKPSPRLAEFLPYQLSIASNAVSARIAEQYRKRFALKTTEWRIMAVLGDSGATTQRELGLATLMDKVPVNRACKKLESRGLVQRKPNEKDGRSHLLELTTEGRAVHSRIMPLALKIEAELFSVLTGEEQAALRARAFQRQADLADRGVGTAIATETAELAASSARQAVLARRQVVTQTEARIDQAASLLSRTKIALADAERRLAETTITAPFDGTLTETAVVEGGLVSANERLAELIDPRDLEVSFRVSTAQYARLIDENGALIKADITARLDVAGIDLEATGAITRASAAAGEGASGRLIFASLTQARGFKPGDFVTVSVQEPALDMVIRLPSSALDAQGRVLVLDDENRLEAAQVDVLRRVGDAVLVRGTIAGREVVEARSPLLGAGIAVKPLRAGAAPDIPEMIELTQERRAKLVAFVEANTRMPDEMKARVLAKLAEAQVPANLVERIESRMGG